MRQSKHKLKTKITSLPRDGLPSTERWLKIFLPCKFDSSSNRMKKRAKNRNALPFRQFSSLGSAHQPFRSGGQTRTVEPVPRTQRFGHPIRCPNPPSRQEQLAVASPLPFGLSSPVLSEDKIFLTGIEEGRLVAMALERKSGKLLWKKQAPETEIEKFHESSSPATPTPFVDENRLFVYFGSFGLLCYDHEGKEIWKKPLPTPKSLYGTSSSPISHGDLLILVVDDDANLPNSRVSRSRILALRKKDGATAWETPRPFHRSGWSTPTIWEHDRGKELVVLGNGSLRGYTLPEGEEKWQVDGFSRETIARPMVGNGLVFASGSKLGGRPT